jgi:putative (di)nucleoside polyphosphate hydrolase
MGNRTPAERLEISRSTIKLYPLNGFYYTKKVKICARVRLDYTKTMKIDRNKLPYRQGVIGIIQNKAGHFLVVQMQSYGEDQWRFPGGGIDKGETPEAALLRELMEELGSNEFEIVKKSNHIIQYEWPEKVILDREHIKKELYRGQQQIQFFVRYTGLSDELPFNKEELRQIAWITKQDFPKYFTFPGQLEESYGVISEFLDS